MVMVLSVGVMVLVMYMALVMVVAVGLRWLPASGAVAPGADYTVSGVLRHAILPWIALTISQIPWLLLTTRTAVAQACDSDAVRGARVPEEHVPGGEGRLHRPEWNFKIGQILVKLKH